MKNEPFMSVNVKKGFQYQPKSVFDTFEYNFIRNEYSQQDTKALEPKYWDQLGSKIERKV